MQSASTSASTMNTRSSPVHAASLVDPATHSPAMMQLIDIRLTKAVIDYLVECVAETVDYSMGRTHQSRGRRNSPFLASFTTFATNVLTRAEVTPATVLVSLVYISRARPHLSIALEEWALERVFLGAIIAASKYTNDSTLKNVHWALCTGVFGKRDVGRIEREFLEVLDWELGVKEADLLAHHQALMEVAFPAPVRTHTHKKAMASLEVPTFRTHARHSSLTVPELEPSSPSSSYGSFSPPTPGSVPVRVSALPKDVPMPMDVDSHHGHGHHRSTSGGPGSLQQILRSFPLPSTGHRIHVAAA
uniref:Cyclin N-terminal domain-containing protein n=1 Tax=Mycena chlorophos TaxID=658473 RepID=A0ABQ0M110_MYCCL|nr:predicted protein [Mycena chlorophos]